MLIIKINRVKLGGSRLNPIFSSFEPNPFESKVNMDKSRLNISNFNPTLPFDTSTDDSHAPLLIFIIHLPSAVEFQVTLSKCFYNFQVS